jgi:anaerobic magnesium-protoporphyrin IX monomethyl ester cyclase
MKIGLLYPEWTGAYGIMGYFARRNSTWPPLNLALIGAILEKAGNDVFIIDGQYEGLPPAKLAVKAVEKNPMMVGFTATSPFFGHQRLCAEEIKKIAPHIITVVGGPHVSIMKKEALVDCFDYGFVGEVEATFPLFVRLLEEGKDIGEVKGLLYRKNGEVVFTGDTQWADSLDDLPVPARHLLPAKGYRLGTLKAFYFNTDHTRLPLEMHLLCIRRPEDNAYPPPFSPINRGRNETDGGDLGSPALLYRRRRADPS